GGPLRGAAELEWLRPVGTGMAEADRTRHPAALVGTFPTGDANASPGPRGEQVVDDSFLVLINASSEPRKWTVSGPWGEAWTYVLDTAADPPMAPGARAGEAGEPVRGDIVVTDRSVVVLRRL